jgi:hypothetical protein
VGGTEVKRGTMAEEGEMHEARLKRGGGGWG